MISNARVKLTEEETMLCVELRAFRKQGFAFQRQVRLGPFTVDFLCRKAKLIFEVDGDHQGSDDAQWNHDRERDAWLKSQGYSVIRVWNADVRKNLDAVIVEIKNALSK